MLSATSDRLLHLPKAELHVHLDGSLRPSTLLELARERDVPLPAEEEPAIARSMLASSVRNLEEYLEPFRITLSVMQDEEALERIAYELVEDHAAEGVRYLEVRFCPTLNTEGGLTPDEVLEAALAGLTRANRAFDVHSNLIVCALRTLPASSSLEMAELAVAFRDRGVCAFDLAGGENGHPVHDHLEAFSLVRTAGLPTTIHAGEAFGPASIEEAIDLGGALRIGHGTRLYEDPALMRRVRDSQITLEVCLTSNVQTRVVRSYEAHPIRRYVDEGVPVTLCTDNRLMSGVTLLDEYEHARDDLGFAWSQLTAIAREGFARAFVDASVRRDLLRGFEAGLEDIV